MERLDKRLAASGRWSRAEAKALIKAGRVAVDGAVCRTPEQKIGDTAAVTVDGVPVASGPVYLMLNKPAGVVSSTDDPREATVMSLLPEEYRRRGLFPAGRLDKDAEGLLLLTDDGPLAHRLLSPRYHVDKVYYVEVDGALDEDDTSALVDGVVLGDGTACLPARLEVLEGGRSAHITVQEGKYHQVKRMLASRGKPVTYLKRIAFGPLILDPELPKGGWRALNLPEIEALFRH